MLNAQATTAAGPTNRAVYAWTHNRAGALLGEASTISGDPANGTVSYAYDQRGTPATTTYDAANRPTAGANPSASYGHDPDGRLTGR